jgi:hypothetical protein
MNEQEEKTKHVSLSNNAVYCDLWFRSQEGTWSSKYRDLYADVCLKRSHGSLPGTHHKQKRHKAPIGPRVTVEASV